MLAQIDSAAAATSAHHPHPTSHLHTGWRNSVQHAAFQKEFEAAGGKVVASESFNNGDQDYRAQLTKLRAANPDVLNISATGPRAYGLALKQAAELNFKAKAVIATDTLIDPQLWEIAGNLASGIYYSVLDFDRAWNEGKFKPPVRLRRRCPGCDGI